MVMDSLLSRRWRTQQVKAVGYADDVLLINTMVNIMNEYPIKVGDWSLSKGLTFNPTKTSVILINRAKKPIKKTSHNSSFMARGLAMRTIILAQILSFMNTEAVVDE